MSSFSSYTPASILSSAVRRWKDVRSTTLEKSWPVGATADWQPSFQPIARTHARTIAAGNPVGKMCVGQGVHGVRIKGQKS
jgi:hypothetical protein